MRTSSLNLLLALISAAAALLAAELGFGLLAPLVVDPARLEATRAYVVRGEIRHYEPRAYTNFGLRRNAGTNDLGFWGWGAEVSREKPPDAVRIACLGASTTQGGGGKGPAAAYPAVLRDLLAARTDRRVEVMNWGASGWTTAETLVNYVLNVQDYRPDLVILHHAVNDVEPRTYPEYRGDYTHFRRPWVEQRFSLPVRLGTRWSDLVAYLMLRRYGSVSLRDVVVVPNRDAAGRLSPETGWGFERNLRTIAEHVRLRGGQPVLTTMPYDEAAGSEVMRRGIADHNRIIRELAAAEEIPLVDLAIEMNGRRPRQEVFVDFVHTTPQGDEWKAELIAAALIARGLVPGGT